VEGRSVEGRSAEGRSAEGRSVEGRSVEGCEAGIGFGSGRRVLYCCLSINQPLNSVERHEASRIFHQITNCCEPLQSNKPYKRITLIRCTYETLIPKTTS